MREADQMVPYIEAGRRNAEVARLVKNWCAHARVVPEGVGIIAVSTGLPIGHHSMACEHAAARGFSAWELSDVALEFHDRNCKGCAHRQPVGLPNLLKLVAERDAAVEKSSLAEQAAAREAASALSARKAERNLLRVGLAPGAADIIDQLDALDTGRTAELERQLVVTARLAPDTITSGIVDYLFKLIETDERWADAAALRILSLVAADARRLVRAALTCLRRSSAEATAAALLVRRVALAEPHMIASALPTLVHMASESRGPFDRNRRPQPTPLIRLNAAHPKAVRDAISAWLDRDRPGSTALAARAVEVLSSCDPVMAVTLARGLISRLTRSAWLPDPTHALDNDHEEVARHLREAIAAVFLVDPVAIDDLLEKFGVGASEAGEVRIASVYARVLNRGRFRRARAVAEGDRLAFRRLLWAAPKARNDGVLKQVQGTIHGDPHDLLELARGEVDSLLGAALQMDERIARFDAEPAQPGGHFLVGWERQSRRMTLSGLRKTFVCWAAAGAAAAGEPDAYLKVLSNLPEDRDELAACMVGEAQPLMTAAHGLNAVLPPLYRALVGASVQGRGGAADLVGEMTARQREDAPDLLMEAFCALLTDPYVLVHTAAVSALRSFTPPPAFQSRVHSGLVQVLIWHKDEAKYDHVVLNCIRLLTHRHMTAADCAGRPGAYLVSLLRKLRPFRLTNDIRTIADKLGRADGMVDLLIELLSDEDVSEHGNERILEALARLPGDVVYANREKLSALPDLSGLDAWRAALEVVEILTRAGAWEEGRRLAERVVAAIPDTKWEERVRQFFEQGRIAAGFEAALAAGDLTAAQACAARWREPPAPAKDDD